MGSILAAGGEFPYLVVKVPAQELISSNKGREERNSETGQLQL